MAGIDRNIPVDISELRQLIFLQPGFIAKRVAFSEGVGEDPEQVAR